MFSKIKKLFTRESSLNDPTWRPLLQNDYSLSSAGTKRLNALGVVGLALQIYSNALIRFPLLLKNKSGQSIDSDILSLLEKPNLYQSKGDFYTHLINNVFFTGNFFCKLDYDQTGKINALLPYVSGSAWAYPYREKSGDFADPIALQKQGYYIRDYRGRVFPSADFLHIKDLCSSSDLLNGRSRITQARMTFESGLAATEAVYGVSSSGLIPPLLIESVGAQDKDSVTALMTKLENFFTGGQARQRRALVLPDGFSGKPLAWDIKSADLSFVKKSSDQDMARIFGLQIILSAESNGPQSAAKEAFRALTHITLKPFLNHIANCFSQALLTQRQKNQGLQFCFDFSTVGSQDLREIGTYIKTLLSAGAITQNEARQMINIPASSQPGANELHKEKIQETEIKQEGSDGSTGNEPNPG